MPQRKRGNRTVKSEPISISDAPKTKLAKSILYIIYIILGVGASIYLSTIGDNMLDSVIPNLGFIAPIIIISIWAGLGIFLLTGRITNWYFRKPISKLICVIIVVVAIWLGMPLYIDYLPEQDAIEFERPYYDSNQVLIHYGKRQDDFFWTHKTVGELKQESSVALIINSQEIFTIYTDGRQILVDAKLFAGYGKRVDELYLPVGSSDNFSFRISAYIDTDARPNKFFARKKGAFELRVDPSVDGTITSTLLGKPVMLTNELLRQPVIITNNALSREVGGWDIRRSGIGYEVVNEKNVPVFILEYQTPYEITVSGLFLTPLGILKVDNNNDDVIFEIGNSPAELGTYTVDRIKPDSIFDIFRPEKTYDLKEIYDKGNDL